MLAPELKKLFPIAKLEPISCAVGILQDGSAGIQLHKTRTPRALVADLEKDSGKVGMPGFGTFRIDPEIDSKLAILTLNKAAGGLGRKLRKALHGTGITKVEIRLEDGSVVEAAGDDDEGAHGQAAPQPVTADPAELPGLIKQIQAALVADPARGAALKPLAAAAVIAVKSRDAAAAAQAIGALKTALADAAPLPAGPDLKALQAELTGLIPQVAALQGDPGLYGTMRKLAAAAVVALKQGQGPEAADAVAALRSALADAAAEGAKQPTPLEIWQDAKSAVDRGISALQQACRSFDADNDNELTELLGQVADKGLHGITDGAAVGMMAAMIEAASPAGHDKALKAVGDIEAFLTTPLAEMIDNNPFDVAIDLRGTLGGAAQAIRSRLAA